MKANEPDFKRVLFVDNLIRGFIAYVGLGLLFGWLAVESSFWGVVKLVLLIFPSLSVLMYFALYHSVINKKLREEGKIFEVGARDADTYASRAAVVVLFLFPMASILGAWSFSKSSEPTAILLILLGGMILAYIHAKFITAVDVPRTPWRISKWVSQHVCDLTRRRTKN